MREIYVQPYPRSLKYDCLKLPNDSFPSTISLKALKTYFQRLKEQRERIDNITFGFLKRFCDENCTLVSWNKGKKERRQTLRYIGATLYTLTRAKFGDSEAQSLIQKAGERNELIGKIKDYMSTIQQYQIGTVPPKGGCYDFVLTDLSMILYSLVDGFDIFAENEDSEKINNIIWSIVCQKSVTIGGEEPTEGGISTTRERILGCCDLEGNLHPHSHATYSGQSLKLLATWGPYDQPETENHVLMIHAWKYLINQYVYWVGHHLSRNEPNHPRYDNRIRRLYEADPTHYNNEGGELEKFLLKALGRVLHNGMFEQNARPYAAFSMQAIMTLCMGANSLFESRGARKVQCAAQNAMEFLIATYTFQSLEGKRLTPRRRNWDNRRKYAIGQNDYMLDIIGMFSGCYKFPHNYKKDEHDRYYFENLEQAGGFALWTALFIHKTNYLLPNCLYDFLNNKHSGYWARINTVYCKSHYDRKVVGREAEKPKYFSKKNNTYVRHESGGYSSSPEFYFCTSSFLNSAGGHFKKYYRGILKVHKTYDFTSVPYTVIPTGDVGRNWPENDPVHISKDILIMIGNRSYPFESRNIWTYKNFSYGYTTKEEYDDDRYTEWAQDYSSNVWSIVKEFEIGRAKFRILDSNGTYDFYAILGQVSKSHTEGGRRDEEKIQNYGRGFWEIIPSQWLEDNCDNNIDVLVTRIKQLNPSSHFPNFKKNWVREEGERHYKYTLAVSGDTLQLHQEMGNPNIQNGIMKIWDHQGRLLDLYDVHADYGNDEKMKDMPLLDVREVDDNFRFTGEKYAQAPGNGWVEIYNPFVGESGEKLTLDSRDIMNPKRELEKV
jgi:hypothetical protein